MVGENPTPYGIFALWAVNGLSIVYWYDIVFSSGGGLLGFHYAVIRYSTKWGVQWSLFRICNKTLYILYLQAYFGPISAGLYRSILTVPRASLYYRTSIYSRSYVGVGVGNNWPRPQCRYSVSSGIYPSNEPLLGGVCAPGSRSKVTLLLPAPQIIFNTLPKLFFHAPQIISPISLLPRCISQCSLNYFSPKSKWVVIPSFMSVRGPV